MTKKLASTLIALSLCSSSQLLMAQDINQLQFGPKAERQGSRIDGIAVIVGNDVITLKELSRLGNDKVALEKLIIKKLLLQEAKKRNIGVGDTALNIAMDGARKKGQKVSRDELRELIIIDNLRQKVAASLVSISQQEVANAVEQRLRQSDTQLQLVDILVRLPQSADSKSLQRAQEKAQVILGRLQSESPQAVAQGDSDVVYNDLGWVPLSAVPPSFATVLVDAPSNQFLSPIVDRDGIHLLEVLGRKSKEAAKFQSPTETLVSHILIKDKDNPKAKETINRIYQQLKNGADFAQVAQQYSQDLGSAANGGSLDWTYPGQMVPDFEAVMNRTGLKQISAPFKSPFGYHILKVYERRQVEKSNQEAIEQQVRQEIFQKRASEAWDLWLSSLREEAYVESVK